MNRKFIEDLLTSIEDEGTKKDIVDKIINKYGEAVEKSKTEIATLKNDLKVKDGVIDDLNNKVKEASDIDVEAIKKEQFELGKQEGSKEVETFKKSIALKDALKSTKAKDIELLTKLIDENKIEYEEENGNYKIKGLEEQVTGLKKSHDYLFEAEPKTEDTKQRIAVGEDKYIEPKAQTNSLLGALHEKYDKK